MHITVEPRDTYSILHLRGEFDTFYCSHLQKEIDTLIAAGVVHLVLNLRLVKFINSTALGAVIKASKALGVQSGKLVISHPSAFCRDIIEKVGLDRVVQVYDTDEAAGAAAVAESQKSLEESSIDFEDDETAVLFSPVDGSLVDHFVPKENRGLKANPVHGHKFGGSWRGVGRMMGLDAQGLRFNWGGGQTGMSPFEMAQMLSIGTDVKVKFRLPLLQKGHCEAVITIDEVEERAEGVKIGASFGEIDDETRNAVQQYAEDMAFLKDELRKATE